MLATLQIIPSCSGALGYLWGWQSVVLVQRDILALDLNSGWRVIGFIPYLLGTRLPPPAAFCDKFLG